MNSSNLRLKSNNETKSMLSSNMSKHDNVSSTLKNESSIKMEQNRVMKQKAR